MASNERLVDINAGLNIVNAIRVCPKWLCRAKFADAIKLRKVTNEHQSVYLEQSCYV